MGKEKRSKDPRDSSEEKAEPKLPPGVQLLRVLTGHQGVVRSVAFAPQGGMLASGSDDDTVKLWEATSGRFRALEGHQNIIFSVAFAPQGGTLASGSADDTVKLWDASSGELLRTLEGHQNMVNSVVFAPEGGTLASGSADSTVKIWDASRGELLQTLKGHTNFVRSVAYAPQGGTLASGSADDTVKLWEALSGRLLHTLEGHRSLVLSVAYAQRGGTLASGSADQTVKLWGAASGRLLRTLEGHTAGVEAVAFSPDGQLLASKSSDYTIRLWSCATWETVAVIPVPTSAEYWIPALAFDPNASPSRPLLATASSLSHTPNEKRCREIHVFELDRELLLGRSTDFQPVKNELQSGIKKRRTHGLETHATAHLKTAKVVLVGESNVGKSYLAHRIATGRPPEVGAIRSTHGMKFWPLEPLVRDPDHSDGFKPSTLPVAHSDKLFGPQVTGDRQDRREIVLWDLGGQEEYRLIHQLFLHDTTVAIILMNPTRGATAFQEVETWNRALEKQLRGRAAVKILVSSRMEKPSQMIDREALERLRRDCGFAAYVETSALTGRGVEDLCTAVADAIDWDRLGETSRPELFQAIRDEIEVLRKRGQVVVRFDELDHELQTNDELETFSLLTHEVAMYSDADAGTRALDAVCSQLAQQGTIARATTSDGKNALILRIEEVERYAGSLILAARVNRSERGVPALELRAIGQEKFTFPEIDESDRLPRSEETAVVECTVQLLLQHGICFEHEGLLIFPSLFTSTSESSDEKLPHSVSLHYDFAGAIDNIYASLVAWLVLAKEFGIVRLWANRAEFEVTDTGLCGLRKVNLPGGFAHVDVYFDGQTPAGKQQEFISFVEDHLAKSGVEIREHCAITCECGIDIPEDILRQRIARGEKDVPCSNCEMRHSLVEGAAAARAQNPAIAKHTWALRTRIEQAREQVTRQVIRTIGKAEEIKPEGPLRLLHLSDLHFTKETPVPARLQWLLDDLKSRAPHGLGIQNLDYLVISGDFTDRASPDGFKKAYEFVSGLTEEYGLSADRCLFVPGNHDVVDQLDAYSRRKDASGLKAGEWFQEGKLVMGRDPEKYALRFEPFSNSFYHPFLMRPYPVDYSHQGISLPFWDSGIQFLLLNSCWQIDEFFRKRSGLHVEAVANAIREARRQEADARKTGLLTAESPLLRVAVWHHAVTGPEQIQDTDFLGNLQKNGVKIALHGDIHQYERNQVGYRHDKGIHVVGSGSFGARANDLPESTPRLYNVFEIARDLRSARVHTRCQPKQDGPWDGWYAWPDPKGDGRLAYYDIDF